MTLFLIIYVILGLFLVIHSKYKYLCNELFWLGMFWLLIVGVYYTSGVVYKSYPPSLLLFIYIILCTSLLLLGRNMGKKSRISVFINEPTKINTFKYTLLGLFGVFIFVFDLFRLNGITLFLGGSEGKNNDYEISMLGALGSLLIPILFVEGLYLIAKKIKYENSFSLFGLLLLIGYSIPCILNNGRESLSYAFISIIVLLGYNKISSNTKRNKTINLRRILIITSVFAGIGLFILLILNISSSRFGDNEINVFLYKNDVSEKTMNEAQSWGDFEFLYYNILSYFSHQLSFLEFTLKEYDGPYMFGLFELNIVSRRLPEFLGLDYQLVFQKLNKLYTLKNANYSGEWNTVLGTFIFDFGQLGCIFVCYFVGYVLGKIRRKFISTYDVRYAVLVAIICASCISTIQLGPFYNVLIYGAFIWWMIIFMHDEKRILPRL